MYRNTKNVPYYVFGRGSLAQLGDLLKPRREAVDGPVVYFVDHFFRDHELIGRLPMEKGDQLHFVDSSSEPEVTRIDAFKEAVSAADSRTPCCVVGIGGGPPSTPPRPSPTCSPTPARPKTIRDGNSSRIPPSTRSASRPFPARAPSAPAPVSLPTSPKISNWA